MNIKFPIKYGNQTVTKEMFLETLNYIICFIENHFDCNLEIYRNALSVFKSMIKATNGINDRRPDKELCKQAFDVLEEIEDYFRKAESDNVEDAMKALGENEYDEEEVRLVRIKFLSEFGN